MTKENFWFYVVGIPLVLIYFIAEVTKASWIVGALAFIGLVLTVGVFAIFTPIAYKKTSDSNYALTYAQYVAEHNKRAEALRAEEELRLEQEEREQQAKDMLLRKYSEIQPMPTENDDD